MLSRLLRFIITGLIFLFIWVLLFLQRSMHYLDPFNNGLQDYEITDITAEYGTPNFSLPYTRGKIMVYELGCIHHGC